MTSTRATFLNQPYGGYDHRDVPKEDVELTHVGPGTPCGEWFRRFWQPVIFLAELQDLPKKIRILGEDLVVFQDRSGQVGVLELHCSHRGASLEFGQVSERGIRCCYHGWLFNVDGRILETPGEPPESTLKDRLYHGAYPTHVYRGVVFVYMGPFDKKPVFPVYDTFELPDFRQWKGLRHLLPCNWLQVKENVMDPAHLSFLHTIKGGGGRFSEGQGFSEELANMGELDYIQTPTGSAYIAIYRVEDFIWIRSAEYIVPNIHQFTPSSLNARSEVTFIRPTVTHWAVPMDDTHTMCFRLRHVKEGERPREEVPGFDTGGVIFSEEGYGHIGVGQASERPYEERQRLPGDFDAQVSQRPIAIHGLEHMATTDRGVTMLRNLVRRGIRTVEQGEDPFGVVREEGKIIPTYANDTVIRIPPAPTPEEDRKLLCETGRQVMEDYIKNPPPLQS